MVFGMRRRPVRRGTSADRARNEAGGDPRATAQFSYEMLLFQQLEEHAHMWQTPALALTAQAFLLTISLNEDLTAAPRVVAALLGAVVALLSVQLMAKHKLHLELDRCELERLEAELGISRIARRGWAYTSEGYHAPSRAAERTWLTRRSSSHLWSLGLWVFLLVDLGIVASEMPGIIHQVRHLLAA